MALSPTEDEIASQYRRMLKMGMPEGAVMQKMNIDGVEQNIQEAVLIGEPAAPSADPPQSTDMHGGDEEEIIDEEEAINDLQPDPEAHTVEKKDSIKPSSVSSFYEEVIEDEDVEEEFDEEEIVEEEVIFDDDDDGQVQHQAAGGGSEYGQSFHSQYTEESYYGGSTEFDNQKNARSQSATASAAHDMESQNQQQQRGIVISQAQSSRRQQVAPAPSSVAREQETSPTMNSFEKSVPSPSSMWYWVVCFLILALLGGFAYLGYWFATDKEGRSANLNPDITESPTLSPVEVETEWDPIQGNCDFDGVANPNPIDQCDCFGSVREIPRDVRERYNYNREMFVSDLYADYDDDIRSCTPRNQALLWVSSGDDDSVTVEERTERFALATIFASLSGADWDNREDWLTYEDVCDWSGVDCSAADFVIRLSIANNNAEGTVSIL